MAVMVWCVVMERLSEFQFDFDLIRLIEIDFIKNNRKF